MPSSTPSTSATPKLADVAVPSEIDFLDLQGLHKALCLRVVIRVSDSKAVAVKTEAQQAVLAMHRMREQLVEMRTMQINALRGLMTEYGEVIGRSRAVLEREMPGALHRLAERLPAMLIDTLRDRWNEVARMDEQIARIEQRIRIWLKQDRDCSAIAEIPGVGLLTATAAVATMADPKAFRSGREFAAFIGHVPRQHGSGGRVSLFEISKRGDTYLRTLLTHGARCVLANAKEPGPWVEQLKKRRLANVVVIALANKLARIIRAVLAHGRRYEKSYSNARPA